MWHVKMVLWRRQQSSAEKLVVRRVAPKLHLIVSHVHPYLLPRDSQANKVPTLENVGVWALCIYVLRK